MCKDFLLFLAYNIYSIYVFKGFPNVYYNIKVNAHPTTPNIKKNNIKLNYILFNDPNIVGLSVEAIVPNALIAPLPNPTTLVGNNYTV
jgi:hypothetical protein